jgi:hypothetical protein
MWLSVFVEPSALSEENNIGQAMTRHISSMTHFENIRSKSGHNFRDLARHMLALRAIVWLTAT